MRRLFCVRYAAGGTDIARAPISQTTGAWSDGRSSLRGVDVDGARAARLREPGREQRVVDAQPHLAAEGVHAVIPPRDTTARAARRGGRSRRNPASRRRCSAERSGSLKSTCPAHAAGSCTSRSSGATLKSPSTAMRGCAASSCLEPCRRAPRTSAACTRTCRIPRSGRWARTRSPRARRRRPRRSRGSARRRIRECRGTLRRLRCARGSPRRCRCAARGARLA